jgi:hypothetical protein
VIFMCARRNSQGWTFGGTGSQIKNNGEYEQTVQ